MILRRKRFGTALSDGKKHIQNLSDYVLSDTEEFVLGHGLNFCLPPKTVCKEQLFAEFESLWAQLQHHKACSVDTRNALKARLTDLAHSYSESQIEKHDFMMQNECYQAIKSLRRNEKILITRPDKGSGVVILNKNDYVTKMENILNDASKFECLGPAATADRTSTIETKLQNRLRELLNSEQLPKQVYDEVRPTGSQRPRMYGLPKTHKEGTPLRPILSMVGSSHHELAKWLASILQPVLEQFSTNCIKDSFTFAQTMQDLRLEGKDVYLCSFDISSLFTNVPLKETIGICAEALYKDPSSTPPIPQAVFIELMESATSSVEFNFNDTMYKQTDGVAMGSPLGPALANIFVGYHESKLFSCVQKPTIYFRYVDDTFAIFKQEGDVDDFLVTLNCLHPALKFTFEKEQDGKLPFLDILVERTELGFETSVYRKPTFSGQYIRWESFRPRKRKTNLIATLVHRALMICTKNKLKQEIDFIKKILLDNGYPENIVLKHISKKIAQFSAAKLFGPEKCPVYLRAPWIGSASQQLEHQVKSAVQNCYGAVSPRLIFSSQCMLPAAKKDVLPANQRSMVIYEYVCHCDSRYVGRTTQKLQERIKQHVPKAIRQKTSQPTRTQPNRKCKAKSKTQFEPESDSAIGQHLLESNQCARNYSDSQFKILTTARSQFHLSLLEAVYISRIKPDLCRQKQFVFTLQLFR